MISREQTNTDQRNRLRRFALVTQPFGATLFDRERVQYFPFDHDAADLLREWTVTSCDATIASQTCPEQRVKVIRFAEHLIRESILGCDGRIDAEVVMPKSGSQAHPQHQNSNWLSGPLVTHVEVIGACNITCTHCFAGSLPRNHDPLRLAEFEALFADLASIGCFRASLTGGEPLLRSDLFDIIDVAIANQLHVTVTTNGTLLTPSIAREFGKRRAVRVNLSLEGATPESNDAVRGAGVFDQVREKTRLLRQHTDFTVGFTLTRQNAAEAEACADLAKQLGARAAVFRPLFPVGLAQQHPEMMQSFAEYSQTLQQILRFAEDDSPLVEDNQECAAGRMLASVSAQGDVNACGFLGSKYVAANIRDRKFSEIWNDRHLMAEFRDSAAVANEMGATVAHEGFRGGCRARALAANGSANASDPWHDDFERMSDANFFPISNLSVTRG